MSNSKILGYMLAAACNSAFLFAYIGNSATVLIGGETFAAGTIASGAASFIEDGSGRGLTGVITVCLIGTGASLRLLVLPRVGQDID